jgi:hypothetical protein
VRISSKLFLQIGVKGKVVFNGRGLESALKSQDQGHYGENYVLGFGESEGIN